MRGGLHVEQAREKTDSGLARCTRESDSRMKQRLTRSRKDRVIAGVLGGFGEYLGWSATKLRIAYVVVSVLSAAFPGILVYLVLWFLMPLDDDD